jgi:hypothetical protein
VRSETREEKDMTAAEEGGVVNGGGGGGRDSVDSCCRESKVGEEEWRWCLVCEERMCMVEVCEESWVERTMFVVSKTRMKMRRAEDETS